MNPEGNVGNELVLWDSVKRAIAECHKVDEIKQIRDKAEGMEVNRWKIIVRGKSTDWKGSGISELKTYIVSWANWAMLNPVKGA
jgi:hypothetical protein